jgi:hypothetical protein
MAGSDIAGPDVDAVTVHPQVTPWGNRSGLEKLVSRVAHNHETAGAEPAPATNTRLG